MLLPEDIRLKVTDITMDLSNSMGAIAKAVFPKAVIVRDCFHVIQRGSDGIEEIRLRLKREAIKEQKKEKTEFNKKMDRLAKQRKAYRKKHKRPKGRKRGRKPMRRTSFTPQTLSNEETKVEGLTRCKKQMLKSRECLDHYAFQLKHGQTTCMDCGHTWPMDEEADRCVCPKCKAKLEVQRTKR